MRQPVERYDDKLVPGDNHIDRQHSWFTVQKLEENAEYTGPVGHRKDSNSIPLRFGSPDHRGAGAIATWPTERLMRVRRATKRRTRRR